MLLRKKPKFAFNAQFLPPHSAPGSYDVILAQSIFTHTAEDMLRSALLRLMPTLSNRGILVASIFTQKNKVGLDAYKSSGWQWRGTQSGFTWFDSAKLKATAHSLGLRTTFLPIYHLNHQTWVAFCNASCCPKMVQATQPPGTVKWATTFS